MTDNPHRRADDCISYKDMVDYVAEHESMMHTLRAESLLLFGRALEKVEEAWEKHEQYHRDSMQSAMSQGSTMRIAIAAIVVSALISLASVVVGILAIVRHP